jgi:hypothetical protein
LYQDWAILKEWPNLYRAHFNEPVQAFMQAVGELKQPLSRSKRWVGDKKVEDEGGIRPFIMPSGLIDAAQGCCGSKQVRFQAGKWSCSNKKVL